MALDSPIRNLRVALVAAVAASASPAGAEFDLTPRPLEKLKEGLVIGEEAPSGYSHIVMLSWPKIRAEDVEATPGTAAKFSQMFGTAILANVQRQQTAAGPRCRIEKLAIGHTVRTDEGAQVVEPDSDGLTFMAGQVLANGDKELGKMVQVARYDSAIVFDAPAILLRGGEHREMAVRHFVWTNAQRGGLATALWVVDPSIPDAPRPADPFFVLLPGNFRDDRVLSVDPDQFTLGIPGRTAFALARLPRGVRVAMTPELARMAALPRFTEETLAGLARQLSLAVAAHEGTRRASPQ